MKKEIKNLKFIDLFAGIGGTRIGFEQACKDNNILTECVFTSEIKKPAVEVYKQNFSEEEVSGDITGISAKDIPDFDVLLAGFPCQAFSAAGSRKGFMDTRGTLFFEIERILEEKKPWGFLLENVEGLVNHDKVDKKKPLGRTLETILERLKELGYKVTWKVIDSSKHGVAQQRKRIYIVGRRDATISLENIEEKEATLGSILEKGKETADSEFIRQLLNNYKVEDLHGKSIKDKRGGKNNIHSWEIEIKGPVSEYQKKLLNKMLTERRKKIWAIHKGIEWMDGMPLTIEEIKTFWEDSLFETKEDLKESLDDLVEKGYLTYEHPKDIVKVSDDNGNSHTVREYRKDLPKGYNIVTGKLSFEVNKILDPQSITPTLVATDMNRLYVPDGDGIRRISEREALRLFGFPEDYHVNLPEKQLYDLLGNTVVVPIIKQVAIRLVTA